MTDIVTRLRYPIMTVGSPATSMHIGCGSVGIAVLSEEHAKADMLEAADEIERLRRLFLEAIAVGQKAANNLQSFGNEMKDLLS